MRKLVVSLLAVSLGACVTTAPSDQQKLASYIGNAGDPVRHIVYRTPISWEKVDGRHLLLQLRPNETWLLRLSGPCLDWAGSVPTISFDNHDRRITAGMDSITFDAASAPAAPMRCRIEEIRPVNQAAARAELEAAVGE